MLLEQPHHDGSPLYVPTRPTSLGQRVPLRVRVPHGADVQVVKVRVLHDAEPAWFEASIESRGDHEAWWQAEIEVHNPVSVYRFYLDGGAGFRWLTGTGVHHGDVTDASDFRLPIFEPPPDWVTDAVVYQVFPDRFARSAAADTRELPQWAVPAMWDEPVIAQGPTTPQQFYGGDLDGVREHLDHLQRLGVTVLYMTPFFPARSNHRYDASTFDEVDPLLGGDEALVKLIEDAHARGIRVIGDLTTNHSGAGHVWFQHALADEDSPEADFYFFTEHPHGYAAWLDVPSLPKFDLRNGELRDRMVRGVDSVAGRWLAEPFGLDGWRIDVGNMTGRYQDVDVNHEVARDIRVTMADINPDTWLVAEHGHDAHDDLQGDGWQGTMNYAGFTRPVWTWLTADRPHGGTPGLVDNYLGIPTGYGVPRFDGAAVASHIDAVHAPMPWQSLVGSMNKLDSHDTARFRTIVGDDAGLQRVGLVMLYTFPSAPMVFAGAETGALGSNGEDSRVPMPWEQSEQWDEVAWSSHQQLGQLRGDCEALRHGGFRWAGIADDALTYLRESANERLLVHVARAEHDQLKMPLSALQCADLETLFGEDAVRRDDHVLLPRSGPAGHIYRLIG
jgi:alpha-glucosidase